MEDVRRRRLENLRRIKGTLDSWAGLARLTGRSASFLVAIAGPHPSRSIGEKLARDLERVLKLPPGWLDAASVA
jgi:hypothetical protein